MLNEKGIEALLDGIEHRITVIEWLMSIDIGLTAFILVKLLMA